MTSAQLLKRNSGNGGAVDSGSDGLPAACGASCEQTGISSWRAAHDGVPAGDRAVLTLAAAAVAASNAERAGVVLEAHINRHAPRLAPHVFERMADVYLSMNSVERAEETLRRGLNTYPDSGRLHRALARTLARMSEWAEALTHWEQVPEDLREAASIWTIISVARAYRLAGWQSAHGG